MRGRQVFMDTLVAQGAQRIFGNPGTTENPLLDSLADYPQISYCTALHEGVAVGAATGYAQASGKTAVVNLHVAPGLGNAIGMLYGALQAQTPMLVTAGQSDTRLRLRAPVLSHDLVAMAAPVTKWSAQPQHADEMAPMLRRAFQLANEPPRGPVFVSLPVNLMEQETAHGASLSGPIHAQAPAAAAGLDAAADILLASKAPGIIAGDEVARSGASPTLVALAESLGAPVWHEPLRAQCAFPSRHPNNGGRLPLERAAIRKALSRHDAVLLVGGGFLEELWFDPGPATPPGVTLIHLCESHASVAARHPVDIGLVGGLAASLAAIASRCADQADAQARSAAETRNHALAQALKARLAATEKSIREQWDLRPMTPRCALHSISAGLPQETVVVDETITGYGEVANLFNLRGPGDYFGGRGGGIGQGIAAALGVQTAFPERPVVALTGDGSAMYSIQALWTAAHHDLPVVFVVLSNREYRVLKHNIDVYRQRFNAPSNRPYPHMDLTVPTLDFVAMAQGMGVAAEQVTAPAALQEAVAKALAAHKPHLIDVLISGKQ